MTGNPFDPTYKNLPREVAVFPLAGTLLLPRGHLPLNVFEPRYLNLVQAALAGPRMFGMIQPVAGGQMGLSVGDDAPLYSTGCIGRITSFQETEDRRFLINLRGVCRFDVVEELSILDGYRRVRASFERFQGDLTEDTTTRIDRQRLLGGLHAYFDREGISTEWNVLEETPDERLITTLAMACPFDSPDKQALLECVDLEHRAKLIIGLLEAELRAGDDDGTPARH